MKNFRVRYHGFPLYLRSTLYLVGKGTGHLSLSPCDVSLPREHPPFKEGVHTGQCTTSVPSFVTTSFPSPGASLIPVRLRHNDDAWRIQRDPVRPPGRRVASLHMSRPWTRQVTCKSQNDYLTSHTSRLSKFKSSNCLSHLLECGLQREVTPKPSTDERTRCN